MEVPKVVFNPLPVAVLLSVQGQDGRQGCVLCPHIPGAPGGSSTTRIKMPRKAFDVVQEIWHWILPSLEESRAFRAGRGWLCAWAGWGDLIYSCRVEFTLPGGFQAITGSTLP